MTLSLVSIIIPVYNEERRIGRTIQEVLGYFSRRGLSIEIIVVDDGSSDGTVAVVREAIGSAGADVHILRNLKNMGKGFSIKRGMLFARGDLVLFTDADLSTPIEEFEKLERAIIGEGYDIAIGSRALRDSRKLVAQGVMRDTLGKLFGLIVRKALLGTIRDSQCGFKAFTRDAARVVFFWQTIFGFGFDPEILYIAQRSGYRIKEVPVVWINDFNSKLNPVRDSMVMGLEFLKIKIKSILGHY